MRSSILTSFRSIHRSNSTRVPKVMVDFAGKLALAPMVRSGELPTRLMALKYGADLVWGPEIVDRKVMTCKRINNEKLNTVDFISDDGKVAFRTQREQENGKLIFQIGSADPELAVRGAKVVAEDVDGIDLNCGCPKSFSTHSGMGAGLLTNPDLLVRILTKLVQDVGKVYNIPISAKIRLLDNEKPDPTVLLIDKICKTGISNLTVHCRTKVMRNREAPLRSLLPELIKCTSMNNVSFIINGAIRNRREHELIKKIFGEDVGCMIAESAECNPSVFSDTPLTWNKVVAEFINLAVKYENHPSNTKYIVLNQIPGKSPFYQKFCRTKNYDEFIQLAGSIDEEGSKIMMKYLLKNVLINPDEFDWYEYDNHGKRSFSTDLKELHKSSSTDSSQKKQKLLEISA